MAATTDTSVLTKKSGKGTSHGLISEVSAVFHVKPGHTDELRAACKRFSDKIKNAPPELIRRFGLTGMRHVIFDGGTRLYWETDFETDWDPYVDDSVNTLGLTTWFDWLQHCEGIPANFLGFNNEQVKQAIQDAQIPATSFVRSIPDLTMGEIRKNQRLQRAFDKVLDDPAAAELLQHPVLKPLLDEAAD